jgi:hypothetical protein
VHSDEDEGVMVRFAPPPAKNTLSTQMQSAAAGAKNPGDRRRGSGHQAPSVVLFATTA